MSHLTNKKLEKKLEGVISDLRSIATKIKWSESKETAFSLLSASSFLNRLLGDIKKDGWK